jgi:hypothetical protein
VLYVNMTPYVLREFSKPYSNLENTGISARRLQVRATHGDSAALLTSLARARARTLRLWSGS